MSKELSKEQQDELNQLMVQMAEEAISVKLDYEKNVSNLDSGSVVVVHQNSPLSVSYTHLPLPTTPYE